MKWIKHFKSGHIPEKDSRDLYISISEELNRLKNDIEMGYLHYEPNISKFGDLKIKNIHKLLPKNLFLKIEKLFDKKDEFDELKKKSDEEIYNIFKGIYKYGDYDEHLYLLDNVYRIIIKDRFKLEDFPKDRFKLDLNKFNQIKKSVNDNTSIKKFSNLRKTIINSIKKLERDMLNFYKDSISFPEDRRNFLTKFNIFITIILVCATIWTAWTSQELVKKQFQRESETFIPNSVELKINAIDGIFINKTDLFNGNQELTLLIENRGRLSSGKVMLSLGKKLTSNKGSYPIDDINGAGKVKKIIPLIPDCFGNKGCNENSSNLPLGIQEVPLNVHCESCEPQDYYEMISICVYSNNLDICQI